MDQALYEEQLPRWRTPRYDGASPESLLRREREYADRRSTPTTAVALLRPPKHWGEMWASMLGPHGSSPEKRGGGGFGFRSEIKEGATASRALRAAHCSSSGDQTDDYTLFGP
jgi:hypothetical protein